MDAVQGKVAWVTGAGSGIGESAALRLAEAGAVAVLTGRREAPLLDVAGPLERYLPHAVGDGREHELKVTWMNGMTSLFEPDVARLSALNEFARYGEVLERLPISTTRLDDDAAGGASPLTGPGGDAWRTSQTEGSSGWG